MKYTNHATLFMTLILCVACASSSKAEQNLTPRPVHDIPAASAHSTPQTVLGAIAGTYDVVSFKQNDDSNEAPICDQVMSISWSGAPSTFHAGEAMFSNFNQGSKSMDQGIIGDQRCSTTDKSTLAKGHLQSIHTEVCTSLKTNTVVLSAGSVTDFAVSGDTITYRVNSTSSNSDIETPIHQECVLKLKR